MPNAAHVCSSQGVEVTPAIVPLKLPGIEQMMLTLPWVGSCAAGNDTNRFQMPGVLAAGLDWLAITVPSAWEE